VTDVVGALIGGGCTSVAWCQVLQQLDARPARRAQCRDPQPRAEDVVEVFLLDVVVLALSRDGETEPMSIRRTGRLFFPSVRGPSRMTSGIERDRQLRSFHHGRTGSSA